VARYVAFLRAINVGGHVVKMADLRQQFLALGLDDAETFIASGNVIFSSRASAPTLERRIEKQLHKGFGYEVATFLRTDAEVMAVAGYEPFTRKQIDGCRSLNVAFLNEPLDQRGHAALMGLRSDVDDFHVNARELYWLCQVGQGDSKFSNVALEKLVGRRSTFRGLNTVRRLADRLKPGA
jgi:uncharacterized protein (DUF1697 family)